jgi:hypothetical protein
MRHLNAFAAENVQDKPSSCRGGGQPSEQRSYPREENHKQRSNQVKLHLHVQRPTSRKLGPGPVRTGDQELPQPPFKMVRLEQSALRCRRRAETTLNPVQTIYTGASRHHRLTKKVRNGVRVCEYFRNHIWQIQNLVPRRGYRAHRKVLTLGRSSKGLPPDGQRISAYSQQRNNE